MPPEEPQKVTIKRKSERPPTKERSDRSRRRTPGEKTSKKRYFSSKIRRQQTKEQGEVPSSASQKLLRVITLGGLEEVGRNMTVLEYNNDRLRSTLR